MRKVFPQTGDWFAGLAAFLQERLQATLAGDGGQIAARFMLRMRVRFLGRDDQGDQPPREPAPFL